MRRIGTKSLVLVSLCTVFFGVHIFAFEKVLRWFTIRSESVKTDLGKFVIDGLCCRMINLLLSVALLLFIALFICVIVRKQKMDLFIVALPLVMFACLSTIVMKILPYCDLFTVSGDYVDAINPLVICILVLAGLLLVSCILMFIAYYVRIHSAVIKTALWLNIVGQVGFFVYKMVGLYTTVDTIYSHFDSRFIMVIVAQVAITLSIIFFLCTMYIFVPSFHKTEEELEGNSKNQPRLIYTEDSLRRFKQLYEEGIITEEEYNAKKDEILKNLS